MRLGVCVVAFNSFVRAAIDVRRATLSFVSLHTFWQQAEDVYEGAKKTTIQETARFQS